MPDELIGIYIADQRFVHAFRQLDLGELSEGSGKGCLAGDVRPAVPAAKTAHIHVSHKAIDQVSRRRDIPDRLGDEGSGKCLPILLWPSGAAGAAEIERLDRHHVEGGDEDFVSLCEDAGLFFEHRKQFILKPVPDFLYHVVQAMGPPPHDAGCFTYSSIPERRIHG